jgi:hypothetical protein
MPIPPETSSGALIENFYIATNIGSDGSNSASITSESALEIKEEAQEVIDKATGNGE